VFRPWLVEARNRDQRSARSKSDGFEALEYRVLRLDGTLTAHEQHSASMFGDIVEQMGQMGEVQVEMENQLEDGMGDLELKISGVKRIIDKEVMPTVEKLTADMAAEEFL
jgi:hypothetical protein